MRGSIKTAVALGVLTAGGLPAVRAGVEISEFMAKNDSTLATAAGDYADWIEIHNRSGGAVDLAGWYLTDEITDLRKWQFPSTGTTSPLADDGYLIVFADQAADAVIGNELHAGFKLGSGGEYLALVEPDGETIAYQYNPEFPGQSADVSYGIDAGTGGHAFFSVPTPGTANGAAIADTVRFSSRSRAFTDPFALTLSAGSPTATIRYTTDGSIPTAASELYVSPISISSTTRIRARAFDAGLVDGTVVSEIFYHLDPDVAGFSSELPLVVIDNFGAGEIPHSDDGPARQPCGIMLLEPVAGEVHLTNSPAITSRGGVRRRGETSKRPTSSKPNLSLETWGEVDEDARSIRPLGMPAESDWILGAPWSIDTAMMRNSFMYATSREAGRYAPRTRFVEVFLNYDGGSLTASDYYGVYELMEKIKQGPNRVDVAAIDETITGEPEVSGGYIFKKDKDDLYDQDFDAAGKTLTAVYPKFLPAAQLNWLSNYIAQVDAAIPNGNYESLIDVASFADHHILNVFAQNADGLRVSTFYHKDRNGLLQMGPIWDFDRSTGCDNDVRPGDPEVWSLSDGSGGGDNMYFFHNGGYLWFRDPALNDADFWVAWVDRWQRMRNGALSDAAMSQRIEGYRTELAQAAVRNYQRWPGVLNATNWAGKVDAFKNHVLTRGRWIDEQLTDPPVFGSAGGPVPAGFQLTMTAPNSMYYTLDASDPRAPGGSPAGTVYHSPVTITENTLVKARAWTGQNFVNAPSSWPWSALTEAMFVVEPAPLAITEIMYHPRPPQGGAELGYTASDFEFIEIRNTGTASCSLVGVQLLDGVEFDFTYGGSTTLAAGAYGVVVRNLAAFKARYSNWATLNLLGEFSGRLSDSTEEIELGYALTNIAKLAVFDYEDDWYPCTDGEGFSLVLRDAHSAASSWDAKTAWRHSSFRDGSPGAADPAPIYAPGSVVINEVLSHQDTDNPGDWIELHNTLGIPVNVGGWFLSDSRGNLKKYEIPAGTLIPANGYIVFTEFSHFGSAFALSEHGDSVYLSVGSGGVLSEPAYRETVSFGGQERDVVFGRYIRSDGSAAFPSLVAATPGGPNAAPRVGPVVFEEIMYHPPVGGHEYVLLRNITGTSVELFDSANPSNVWKVSGMDFTFPAGTSLPSGEALLLVRNTITPAAFRAAYQVPQPISILSYSGALDNDADTLVLKRPGNPEAGTGYVPYITVDEVKYNDSAPWPAAADGRGRALGRISSSSYANDVANWEAVPADYIPTLYSLAVNGGSGSGLYTEQTPVPVQAAQTDLTFVRWIGNVNGVSDVWNPAATITMPAQDITVSALYSVPATFVGEGAVWKYNDLGQDLGTAWRDPVYDDSGWPQGAAQLGYNDSGTVTTLGYGGDAGNKYPTTWFRHRFAVDDASSVGSLTLELLRDDGAVVYLNGHEVVRDNMPAGTITYQTRANSTVGGEAENTFYSFGIAPSNLVSGVNLLAVEIHQRSPTSSDLSFNARLTGVQVVNPARLDGDADGLFDNWETNYFGSTESALPGEDPDGDGCVNSNEFIAGTLPMDVSSYFRIEQFDGSELSWTAVSGRTYSVYWTDSLQNPFVPLAGDVAGGSHSGAESTTNASGFYRIDVEMD